MCLIIYLSSSSTIKSLIYIVRRLFRVIYSAVKSSAKFHQYTLLFLDYNSSNEQSTNEIYFKMNLTDNKRI